MIRITMKDHGDRYHVIDITMIQQQPEDSGPTEEFNILTQKDYGMINIDELIND